MLKLNVYIINNLYVENMIMNIRANGPEIYFSKYLGLKLQSPIDNMQCYNFKSILNIFDGSLFNAILNDKIDHKHYREIENIQKLMRTM